jgi:uncharacterized GH25 family protein
VLLFENKPIANRLVEAMNPKHPELTLAARTDEHGRVTFTLPEPGFWLIGAVHMVEAPAETGADWESIWASLTFDLPAPAVGTSN